MPTSAGAGSDVTDGASVGIREPLDRDVDRHVGERGERAAREHDPLAADPVGEPAEDQEERRPDRERAGHERVGELPVEVQRLLEERERVELARVPDHALAGGGAEQRDQHVLQVASGCVKLSRSGFAATWPSSRSFVNSGDSRIRSRM